MVYRRCVGCKASTQQRAGKYRTTTPKENHDATIGINWDVIEIVSDDLFLTEEEKEEE
ncbi:hypothetical protein [Legionella hackeliae]|uniref:hypothetical protein n=1 Tax=Legionella hackeliae TaxID=449 RepID=UPI00211441D5|nr:hypothetical protein [Legionella hackeliae]